MLAQKRCAIETIFFGKELRNLRVAQGQARLIGQQILLRDVRDIFGLIIFCEQVIEWLILSWTPPFRNGRPPFLGRIEHGIHVEDDAPKRVMAVAHHFTQPKLGLPHLARLGLCARGALLFLCHGVTEPRDGLSRW